MELDITTPILLFPAISLILLAYTEKFLHLGRLSRNLKKQYDLDPQLHILDQLQNIRKRVYLIRDMQALGTGSFFLCIMSIFLLFTGYKAMGWYCFWISILLLMIALLLSFREIRLSANALKLVLKDTGDHPETP